MNERQIEYMTDLAACAGDPDPIPDWWARMRVVTKELRDKYRDSFRDKDINDFCYDRAKEYFSFIRKQNAENLDRLYDSQHVTGVCLSTETASMECQTPRHKTNVIAECLGTSTAVSHFS